MAFRMKGYRCPRSPFKQSNIKNLTQAERERLYEQMKEEEEARHVHAERLKVHRPRDLEEGSAY